MKERFKYYSGSQTIRDEKTGNRYYGSKQIVDLLNKLYNENQEFQALLTQIVIKTELEIDYKRRICSVTTQISPDMYERLSEMMKNKMW